MSEIERLAQAVVEYADTLPETSAVAPMLRSQRLGVVRAVLTAARTPSDGVLLAILGKADRGVGIRADAPSIGIDMRTRTAIENRLIEWQAGIDHMLGGQT